MTCFIIATGPSLTQDDVDLVRGRGTVIAVNNAVFMAPWADILFASDRSWWKQYNPEWFAGERLSIVEGTERYGCTVLPRTSKPGFGRDIIHCGYNSGFHALNLAIIRRYDPICLLGFDMQHTGGRTHCHGDHPRGMGNAGPVKLWLDVLEAAAVDTHGVSVTNCTRETALRGFPRMTLEAFIERCDSGRVSPTP